MVSRREKASRISYERVLTAALSLLLITGLGWMLRDASAADSSGNNSSNIVSSSGRIVYSGKSDVLLSVSSTITTPRRPCAIYPGSVWGKGRKGAARNPLP